MKSDEMIKVMRDAGWMVDVYPGVGKAFASKNDVLLEAKNTKSLYYKFKKHTNEHN